MSKNFLPSKVGFSCEDSGSAEHLQERRTITPPSTPSSLARKGEPGQNHWGELLAIGRVSWAFSFLFDFLPSSFNLITKG